LEYLDSSPDLEIGPTAVGLLRHLEQCPDCSAEINARRALRDRLRGAVHSIDAPLNLDDRIRAAIRPNVRSMPSRPWIMAVAACLAIAFGLGVAYQLGRLRFTTESQNAYIASISSRIPSVMAIGLKDHVHCSVYRKYPKAPPSNESLLAKLGLADSGLLAIVQRNVPSDFRAMIAHHCGYKGRKYTHIVMQSDSHLMSLVIAKKGDGESLGPSGISAMLSESGIPVYTAGVQRFRLAAFETRDHLVYVVSDLSAEKNAQLMLAMAPALKEFLLKQES
jgi:hypothetical protein